MNIKTIFKLIGALTILTLLGFYFYPEPKLPAKLKIDSLVVYKSQRELLAFSGGILIKTYKISLGGNPTGKKN